MPAIPKKWDSSHDAKFDETGSSEGCHKTTLDDDHRGGNKLSWSVVMVTFNF